MKIPRYQFYVTLSSHEKSLVRINSIHEHPATILAGDVLSRNRGERNEIKVHLTLDVIVFAPAWIDPLQGKC